MSTALHIVGAEPSPAALDETVASLPISFTPASSPTASDVVALDGGREWLTAARHAIERGVRGLVVVEPGVADPRQLRDLAGDASRSGVEIVLDEPFAGNPAVPSGRAELEPRLEQIRSVFVELVSGGGDAIDLGLHVLRALRSLGFTDAAIDSSVQSQHSVVLDGTVRSGTDRIPFGAFASTSAATTPNLAVRCYGPDLTIAIDLPASETARPATVVLVDARGRLAMPTIYESSHRAALRRMHESITGAAPSSAQLPGFAEDVETVVTALALIDPRGSSATD